MKPSWTVARLVKEHPQCRVVLRGYDIIPRDYATTSLRDLAEEIEEDLDDFLDELDQAANTLSEYDVAVVGDEDDFDEDDDEVVDDDAVEETDESEELLDEDSPLGDADDSVDPFEDDDDAEDDDDDL